jgi:hypothetical protein
MYFISLDEIVAAVYFCKLNLQYFLEESQSWQKASDFAYLDKRGLYLPSESIEPKCDF